MYACCVNAYACLSMHAVLMGLHAQVCIQLFKCMHVVLRGMHAVFIEINVQVCMLCCWDAC